MGKKRINPADPNTIPKFVDKLRKPPVAKPVYHRDYPESSYYELEMKEDKHRFHLDFPLTKIWGYDGISPGPTFEAFKDKPLYVKYLNRLPEKHFLPVDYSLHGSYNSPEVRSVVHLHGAHVNWESDGHPEAWYTRNYEKVGPTFRRKVHAYTNNQPGMTMWYHDHAMGATRLNVFAGLAGFYLLRDPSEEKLNLPSGKYEYPLMIQDRSFNEDGSLFYPDSPDPPPPVPVHPSITLGVTGNTNVVNGKVWPYLNVEPRKYRFRILNAANRRGYVLSLSNGENFTQIGTDSGLLTEPVSLSSIELLPAERTDIIIDFSSMKGEDIILRNTDEEFPDEHTNVVMEFLVDHCEEDDDDSSIPEKLQPEMHIHAHQVNIIRDLPLTTSTDEFGRLMLMQNNSMYSDPATEKPALDSIEIWNFINATPVAHPMHVHLVRFKILDRQPFDVERYDEDGVVSFTGPPEEPRVYERGWKDVIKADAGMVSRIIMHFREHTGNYIWHCHFLEHEDHDMMRPMRIVEDTHSIEPPRAHIDHTEDNQSSDEVNGSAAEDTSEADNDSASN